MKKILIIEDDKTISDELKILLDDNGYDSYQLFNFHQVAKKIIEFDPDLVLLDIVLPGTNGQTILKEIRKESNLPVIMLTSKTGDINEIMSMSYGADDYITKPFSLMALVSKVNALMRRLSKVQAQIMSSGEITVHMKTMQVYKGDEPVTLSKKEFSLLLYLWENAGQIVSKESILEHVWDIDGQFVDDNTVTVNISRLKNKLGTEEIANVRGLGYIWTGKVNKN